MCDSENKTPYTNQEKVFVASLVEEHKDCLESKKTDASSLQAKARAWEKITDAFNANFKCRTSKQLRKLWDNLKHRTRKIDTDFKYQTLRTGGGPPPREDDDPINQIVRNVVPTISLEVLSPFDSNESNKSEDKSDKPPLPKRPKVETSFQAVTEPKPSTSTSGIQQEKKEEKRTARKEFVNDEGQLRIQKLKEGIEQAAEWHRLKMSIGEAEKRYWDEKTKLLPSSMMATGEAEKNIGRKKQNCCHLKFSVCATRLIYCFIF